MQVIQMSEWFACSRLYTELDFKRHGSLSVCKFHSVAGCPLKSSDQWLVGSEALDNVFMRKFIDKPSNNKVLGQS